MNAQHSRPRLQRGYVQVYTGSGKGKSTAAFGLAIRAAGAGLKVFIAQFVKGRHCSEVDALERFAGQITLKQYGRGCFIGKSPTEDDVRMAREALEEVSQLVASGQHDVVILDEANIATHYGLIPVEDLLALIDSKPDHVELVITGRRADPRVIERADLVTEMREVKHYYRKGIGARKGIEE